jgi:hypothetical protein
MKTTIIKLSIFITLILSASISCPQEEKDGKWQYGVGVGLHQVPFMYEQVSLLSTPGKIETKNHLSVGLNTGISAKYVFGKRKKFELELGLNYVYHPSNFSLQGEFYTDSATLRDTVKLKYTSNQVFLNFGINYLFNLGKHKCFMGVDNDILWYPISNKTSYTRTSPPHQWPMSFEYRMRGLIPFIPSINIGFKLSDRFVVQYQLKLNAFTWAMVIHNFYTTGDVINMYNKKFKSIIQISYIL